MRFLLPVGRWTFAVSMIVYSLTGHYSMVTIRGSKKLAGRYFLRGGHGAGREKVGRMHGEGNVTR